MKRYFYITIHFFPDYEGKIFSKQQDGLYINVETGELYRKRLLYDFGWGQENGFELMPQLSFDELIQLVEEPVVLPQKKFWQKYTKEEMRQADIWRSNLCRITQMNLSNSCRKKLIRIIFQIQAYEIISNAFLSARKKRKQKAKFPEAF